MDRQTDRRTNERTDNGFKGVRYYVISFDITDKMVQMVLKYSYIQSINSINTILPMGFKE